MANFGLKPGFWLEKLFWLNQSINISPWRWFYYRNSFPDSNSREFSQLEIIILQQEQGC